MFERFTDRARRVVVLAKEEARAFDHNYTGTEHLLLGLVGEREGIAGITLAEVGVDLTALRTFVVEQVGVPPGEPDTRVPFTPRAKKVLELSLREALHLKHGYIGTEHILLGILREGEGMAVQALLAQGIDLESLRQKVVTRLGEGARQRARDMLFGGGGPVNERLRQIQESLDRIERRLDAMGPPDDEKKKP